MTLSSAMLVLMMVVLIIDFSDTVMAGGLPWTFIRALILRLRIYFNPLHPCSAVLDSGVFLPSGHSIFTPGESGLVSRGSQGLRSPLESRRGSLGAP